jgi:hypothetical protein
MNDRSPATEDLRNLIHELHTHMRHNMALWVQWFTFFVGVNYIAFGWVAVSDRNKMPAKNAVLIAACLFTSQCALGIWISLSFKQWLTKADRELFGLYKKLHAKRSEPSCEARWHPETCLSAHVGGKSRMIPDQSREPVQKEVCAQSQM